MNNQFAFSLFQTVNGLCGVSLITDLISDVIKEKRCPKIVIFTQLC